MRVLVTGGAGYAGSMLTRKLLSKGYQVKVIDALWYGSESIAECQKNENFQLIKDDIRNLNATVKAIEGVDAVVHLASIVGMNATAIAPKTSEVINYLSTKNIVELCKLYDIDSFIFASTCSVYGTQPNSVITEESFTMPLDFYSEQKFHCEQAIASFDTPSTIFRFGTLFGLSYRMRFDIVINLFIAQAITEGKITVFGGDQHRPILHVSDAVDSIIFGLESNLTGTYNVVHENLTIMEIAERIRNMTGCKIEVLTDDIDKRDYSVTAGKINKVGFSTSKNLEFAFEEIKTAFDEGKIKNFKDRKYNNYELLLNSHEMTQRMKNIGK